MSSSTGKAVCHNYLCRECLFSSPLPQFNDYYFLASNISAKDSGFSAFENISFSKKQSNQLLLWAESHNNWCFSSQWIRSTVQQSAKSRTSAFIQTLLTFTNILYSVFKYSVFEWAKCPCKGIGFSLGWRTKHFGPSFYVSLPY